MRKIFWIMCLACATNTALAHTVDGDVVTTLSHQFFGAHHLLIPVVLIAVIIYSGRKRKRGDRV